MHETHYFVVLISCLHETTEFDLKSRLYGSDISLNANYNEMNTNTNSNLISYLLDKYAKGHIRLSNYKNRILT